MKAEEVRSLRLGLYKVYWKKGGWSLAAVGEDERGKRWLVPTNWLLKGNASLYANWHKTWRNVEKAELLFKK